MEPRERVVLAPVVDVFGYLLLCIQTMGGNFTTKGQQNCSKGIYVLAGKWNLRLIELLSSLYID